MSPGSAVVTNPPDILHRFPALAALDEAAKALLAASAVKLALPEGAHVYEPGGSAEKFLLVADGTVVVRQFSESGREIVLYRVGAGESCLLTTACLIGGDVYPAEAVTETAVVAYAVPRTTFEALLAGSADFRRFVFAAWGHRVVSLLKLVEQVAFQRLDSRLAEKLLELAHGGDEIDVTQAELAAELGTAREVVSRALAELQRHDLVKTARGRLQIINRKALAELAGRST